MGDDLPPHQRATVADLAESTAFTRDEARRIVRFAHADRGDRCKEILLPDSPDTYSDGVDLSECACIREDMTKAETAKEVVEMYPGLSPSAIFAHAKGRCNHEDVGTPTTLSPRIGEDECVRMRDAFVGGDTINKIKASTYRSTNAVLNHVFGDCKHDHGPRGTHLSDDQIDRLKATYAANATRTMGEVASAFRISPSTVHYHVEDERRDESH